jgi:capsular exopolysaccharide synthesis family protein
MELQTYLSIVNKRKKQIAIVFSALFLLVVIITLLIPPKYSSTARLRVLTPIGGGTNYLNFDIWYASRLMNTYASMASSSAVKDEIKKKFNRTTDPDISATVIADSELIRITVVDSDPNMSASIANSIAEILLANKNDSAMQAQTASDAVISNQLEAVNQKLIAARAKYREIYIPYTQNNNRIAALNSQIQNDQNLYISIKDRIEAGRQTNTSAAVLNSQESQLEEIQARIDQKSTEVDAMNAKAAEEANLIDSAQRDIALLENQYSNIVLQMDQMKSLQALQYGSESLILVDEALPSSSPSVPNYLLVFVLGFFIALFLAVLVAVTLENMDDSFLSPNQISALHRTPFWGETFNQEDSQFAQNSDPVYQVQAAAKINELKIENFPQNQSLRSIIVSGVEKETAITGTIVKMALEFARQGRKTILIDGNLNNPTVHTHFLSVANEYGLRDVLDGKVSLKAAISETGRNNLAVLTAGQPEGKRETKINFAKMEKIIEELQARYSMVIVGIPCISEWQRDDSFIYQTDGVVLAIEYGNSRKRSISRMIAYLENLNIPFLGYVLAHEQKSAPSSHHPENTGNRVSAAGLDHI